MEGQVLLSSRILRRSQVPCTGNHEIFSSHPLASLCFFPCVFQVVPGHSDFFVRYFFVSSPLCMPCVGTLGLLFVVISSRWFF